MVEGMGIYTHFKCVNSHSHCKLAASVSCVLFLFSSGGEDIAQGNIKLILGLIWTLILHYQISVALGGDDMGKSGPTPKQALLTWLQGMLKVRLSWAKSTTWLQFISLSLHKPYIIDSICIHRLS